MNKQIICLWNSLDYLEIAVNQGNAAKITKFDYFKDELFIILEDE